MKRLLGFAAIAAALAVPSGAYAATAHPAPTHDTMTIRGVISSIDGKYGLTVQTGEGLIEEVALHPGTIIAPTGLRLSQGMQVSVLGYQNHANFEADRIVGPIGSEVEHGTGGGTQSLMPQEIPDGTFQTEGPTAIGGG